MSIPCRVARLFQRAFTTLSQTRACNAPQRPDAELVSIATAAHLMPNHSSPAVANYFVGLAGRGLPQMKLHKLSYIGHGWNLAINDSPLVSDKPQAWDNGPVFRIIWDAIKDHGTDDRGMILTASGKPFVAGFTLKETTVLDHVWRKYGAIDQYTLSNMTHQPDTPWSKAYFERFRNSYLKDSEIRDHYVKLAMAGRESKQQQ